MLITEGRCVICVMQIDHREILLVEDNTKNLFVSKMLYLHAFLPKNFAACSVTDPGSKFFPFQIPDLGLISSRIQIRIKKN
jgi:hypothetical protein